MQLYFVQITAETAYDLMSPGPSVRRGRVTRKGKRKRIHPPQDIREGVANACQIVREVSFSLEISKKKEFTTKSLTKSRVSVKPLTTSSKRRPLNTTKKVTPAQWAP
jgi:hypothetical protein